MAIIRIAIEIAAAPAVCFDLARSVDAHVASTSATGERAVGGVTTGLLNLGDEVRWRARHFGVTQELTSRITALDRPNHFRDEMVRNTFRRLVHDHHFEACREGTRMVDVFDFSAIRPTRLARRVVVSDGVPVAFSRNARAGAETSRRIR